MSQIKQTIVIGIQIFFLSAKLTCAQGFDRGFLAYMLGDYETAIIEWRNKASLGSVTAMANLGNMYEVGAGVEQSYINDTGSIVLLQTVNIGDNSAVSHCAGLDMSKNLLQSGKTPQKLERELNW